MLRHTLFFAFSLLLPLICNKIIGMLPLICNKNTGVLPLISNKRLFTLLFSWAYTRRT